MIVRSADAVRIRVEQPASGPSHRVGEPLTIGVPVPRRLASTAWSLRDQRGKSVPVQITPQAAAPDASIRWLLVDWQADVHDGVAAEYELQPVDERPVFAGMRVDQTADGTIAVAGGPVEFIVAGRGDVLLATRFEPATQLSVQIVDSKGRQRRAEFSKAVVELSGPLRAVVRVDGCVAVDDASLRITARIHFFDRLGSVRVELCVTNPRRTRHRGGYWDLGDPGSIYLRDLSVVCTPSGPIDAVACTVDAQDPPVECALPLEIYQDSSGGENWRSPVHVDRSGEIPVSFRGYRIVSAGAERRGARATPIVRAHAGRIEILAAVPQFWENFPKAIEVDRAAVTLRLFPSQLQGLHELQGGERKTHEFVVSLANDRVTPSNPLAWALSPSIPALSPEAYAAAGVWQPLSVGSKAARCTYRRLIEGAIDGPASFACKREEIDEYGWRHFGDLYADHEAVGTPGLVSHYNNQYDPVRGFATRFCETGDVRWWALMQDLARHVADVDIYHSDDDRAAYRGGMFWHTSHYVDARTSTHRAYPSGSGASGGPSNEHNYTSGLLLHHRLTGAAWSRDAVIGLAEWVLRMDDGAQTPFWWLDRGETGLASATRDPDYHGPGRGAAYSINTLIDAHDLTGDVRYLAKIERLIRRCIHPADDPATLELLDAERRWSYTVFLQVLGKYLEYRGSGHDRDSLVDYARVALLNYATWMMAHDTPYLSRADQLEYPTETWAAQDLRKAAVLEFAARYAPDVERQRAFLAAADRFFDESLQTLERMPTRTLTRPIVLLLAYGFQRPMSDAAAPADDLSTARFGPSTTNRFVPYKRRVMRRLGLLAAASTMAGAAAALMLILG